MKLYTTTIAALFGLLMMAMPGVASADVVAWHPQNLQPVVVQETVAPMPLTTVAYYRPWACANRYFRRHHPWLCR
ncbi:MAG: hypothetical protein WA993_05630 [Candidatus Binatus sp.]|jgi:hypothetical protein|uniref:hypothetical protein n=1 Tax=Candidatus Binatus sp. TaxID=2811406 RepID=UPI003CB8FF30